MKLNSEIVKGGFILLVSTGIFSFLGFVFQIFMARSLSIVEYGLLATLFSIIYIFGFFTEFLQTLIAKYASLQQDATATKQLLGVSLKKSGRWAFITLIIYLTASFFLYRALNIPYGLLAFNGLFIFAVFFVPVTRGILQGKKEFASLGFNFILEGVIKLGAGVIFVYVGWNVSGAIGGAMLGTFLAFVFSLIPLKSVLSVKTKKTNNLDVKIEPGPTFIIILTVMVFYSIDVVIARMVFSEEVAGIYSIASILSKTIFWITQPISKVMLPIVARDKHNPRGSRNAFTSALFIVLIIAFFANLFFYFFDELIVQLFSGKIIAETAQILPFVGLAMSFISLANLVLLYKLSKDSVKGILYLWLVIPLEIAVLFYFSANLVQFSIAYIAISAFFLLFSLVLSKLKRVTNKV